MIYGYDPIFLEKIEVNEWLKEDEDNILLVIEDSENQVNLSKSFLRKACKRLAVSSSLSTIGADCRGVSQSLQRGSRASHPS